jgi:NhaP-type Na+/H+ and K+/H+ antiporter
MYLILKILGWLFTAFILFYVAAWLVQFKLLGALVFGAVFGLAYVAILD